MQYEATLVAGREHRHDGAGTYFSMLDLGGTAGALTVRFYRGNELLEELRNVSKRFKARAREPFDRVLFNTTAPGTISFVVSFGSVDIEGGDVNATIAGPLPLPVSNDRGSPGNLVHVTGVSLADAPATSTVNGAAVACGPVAAVVAAADANRRALRLCNLGPDPVAIGAAGITWAARCIVLEVGDVWLEDRGANLAWSAITDAGKAASVTAQGVLA